MRFSLSVPTFRIFDVRNRSMMADVLRIGYIFSMSVPFRYVKDMITEISMPRMRP